MEKNAIVFPLNRSEQNKVMATGCQVLAMYTDRLLIVGSSHQIESIRRQNIKIEEVPPDSWESIMVNLT